jgi:DNA repair protein RadC
MKLPQIEISIKYKGTKKADLETISSSNDIYTILKMLFNQNTIDWTEEVILICLSRANKVMGYYKVSAGGITATVVDPKVIFTIALNCAGTTNIILAHNHPSGNLTASNEDNAITQKIKNVGEMLDIKLLDHLIVTSDGYYSYNDEGKI